MAGHNKWSKVKHIKERVDAKKGKVFSKISREITIAARLGGRDPEMNPRLRTALLAGRAANMPNENVDRAIKKGVGELEGALPEEITYEGYAPGGVAMLIEAVTDNKNRSSADLRTAFNKGSGTMGAPGRVAHLFHAGTPARPGAQPPYGQHSSPAALRDLAAPGPERLHRAAELRRAPA